MAKEKETTIIEKNNRLGKKLLITGKGRNHGRTFW